MFKQLFILLAILPAALCLRTTTRDLARIQDLVKSSGGCNANICFALDSSGSVTDDDFTMLKDFVLDVIAAIDGNVLDLAVAQYGKKVFPIVERTSDIDRFILTLDRTKKKKGSNTNMPRAIRWCLRQLYPVRDEAVKMVLLGNGKNGADARASKVARRFRRLTGGKVCAVGIAFDEENSLKDVVGGDESLLLMVDEYLELADVVEEMVKMVCGIDLLR